REMPDNAFDLAIVDPPYGGAGYDWAGDDRGRFGGRFGKYAPPRTVNHAFGGRFGRYSEPAGTTRNIGGAVARTGGTWAAKYSPTTGAIPSADIRHWDYAPPPEYFEELFRVSRHQIIWGGNYFNLPPSRNFIVWRKLTISEGFSMAMAEYAWTDIPGNAKVFECAPQDSARFHPTQKPVALYRWLLSLYAKPGDRILDTHMGSGSSVVACAEHGYTITAVEINKGYFSAACRRIADAYKQPRLFEDEKPQPKPQGLFEEDL
ncbi:MAG: DNA methyltransferase, partial [Candidatus Omnitrophota bacterium]